MERPPLLPLLLLLLLAISGTGRAGCPSEAWQRHGDQCYLSLPDPPFPAVIFRDARKQCDILQSGATPPIIHSSEANDLIHMLQGDHFVWLGLTNYTGPGWEWLDESPVDFYDWYKYEPDNNGGDEYCTAISTGTGQWFDFSCEDYYGVICQYPATDSADKEKMEGGANV